LLVVIRYNLPQTNSNYQTFANFTQDLQTNNC
jgi:hypothetical protein